VNDQLVVLAVVTTVTGLLSFGGLAAVLGSLHHSVVGVYHLVSAETFASSYALAVAAPGSSAVFLPLLGYQVAGWPGVLTAALAWGLSTNFALWWIGRTASSRNHPFFRRARRAVMPVVLGMLLASAGGAVKHFSVPVGQTVLALVALVILSWGRRRNPIWVVLGCAAAGALGLI